jgi:hypothetical protein
MQVAHSDPSSNTRSNVGMDDIRSIGHKKDHKYFLSMSILHNLGRLTNLESKAFRFATLGKAILITANPKKKGENHGIKTESSKLVRNSNKRSE